MSQPSEVEGICLFKAILGRSKSSSIFFLFSYCELNAEKESVNCLKNLFYTVKK